MRMLRLWMLCQSCLTGRGKVCEDDAPCVDALSVVSDREGERPMVLEAVCVILMSLFLLLMVNIVKRQGNTWVEFCTLFTFF